MRAFAKFFVVSASVLALLSGCNRERKSIPQTKPNVLLIVVDTLSAKHIGVYDKALKHTPRLNQFAQKSSVFDWALSPAPWTKPAIASIFTSHLPSSHKVTGINTIVPQELEMMSELFKNEGYKNAGIVSHTLISPQTGYSQGFDSYKLVKFRGNVHDSVTSDQVTKMAIKWLKKEKTEPFFLFLHYFDPHFNYQHHERFDQSKWYKGDLSPGLGFRELRRKLPKMNDDDRRYLISLYHEEIAFTDEQIGKLFDYLERAGLDKKTIVVITADHGEEFLDHGGLGHTRTLYDELIHVPLIISWPAHIRPQRVGGAVSTVDILPTVLELAGITLPGGLQGLSLKDTLLTGTPAPGNRDIFSEVDFKSSALNAYKLGVVNESWKLIRDKVSSEHELYDRTADPAEKQDKLKSETERANGMKGKLDSYATTQSKTDDGPGEVEHSPEEVEQLKSLGYM